MKRARQSDVAAENEARDVAERSARPHATPSASTSSRPIGVDDGVPGAHASPEVGDGPDEDLASLRPGRGARSGPAWSDFIQRQPRVSSRSSALTTPSSKRQKRRSIYEEGETEQPLLPWPRGPLSDFVIATFASRTEAVRLSPPIALDDPLEDDDFQLALYLCYELHYRDVARADLEWDPSLLSFRGELERVFLYRLRQFECPSSADSKSLVSMLDSIVQHVNVRGLGEYLELHATLDQLREFCAHRSVSFSKSGDANSFGIARLRGGAKAAMAKIQFAEMGYGEASSMNSSNFAATMMALGLDPRQGAYAGHLPAASLAQVNLESLFGLHRRWKGALVGAVVANKLASVDIMDHCLHAMFRLDGSIAGANYFGARMNADAIHAFIARDQLLAGLIATEPAMIDDVLFGATAQLRLEENFARHVLGAWADDRSSLVPWGAAPNGDARFTLVPRGPTLRRGEV